MITEEKHYSGNVLGVHQLLPETTAGPLTIATCFLQFGSILITGMLNRRSYTSYTLFCAAASFAAFFNAFFSALFFSHSS